MVGYLFRVIAFITILALSACGVQRTTLEDGSVTSRSFIGASEVLACNSKDAVSFEQTAIGAWIGRDSSGLGYRSQRFACPNPKCQLVVWAETPEDLATLRKLVGDMENICVI